MARSYTPLFIFICLLTILAFGQIQMSAQAKSSGVSAAIDLMIDAGGHKLHLHVMGQGSPAVIFENGSGDFSFIWSLVQPEVSKSARTVSYDRAGYAWSEPGPTPRTSRQITFELHSALKNARIDPPYILVGQSYGGFLVRAFARYYPNEVAGVVLVEAVQEDQRIFMGGDTPHKIREFAQGRPLPDIQSSFSSKKDSIAPLNNSTSELDPLFSKFPDSIQRLQLWAQSQPSFIKTVQTEMDWSPEDVADLYNHLGDAKYMLGDLPLIVLTRGKGGFEGRSDSLELERERLEAQAQLAKLSRNSKHVIVQNSGHNIHVEDPAIVIEAINEVINSAKKHTQLR
jgi:pimeloyl-ACP methyl ester carboxylesterase